MRNVVQDGWGARGAFFGDACFTTMRAVFDEVMRMASHLGLRHTIGVF